MDCWDGPHLSPRHGFWDGLETADEAREGLGLDLAIAGQLDGHQGLLSASPHELEPLILKALHVNGVAWLD